MKRILRTLCPFVLSITCLGLSAHAQVPGNCISLAPIKPEGVPLHREARNSFSGQRIPGTEIPEVLEVSDDGRWFRVQSGDLEGWVVEDYIGAVVPCPGTEDTFHGAFRVGTWNLEHFTHGKKRGFPEFMGQDAIRKREDADLAYMAQIILSLDFKVLTLQEVDGDERTVLDSDSGFDVEETYSDELDSLLGHLGNGYQYVIGDSGGSQRIAFLYDSDDVALNWTCEPDFENLEVQGKGVFDRRPLLGYFTFFHEGVELNDFVFVGVHLASGQHLTRNHDKAMGVIDTWIEDERADDWCVPRDEFDVRIAGDFNANRFDNRVEQFWDEMESDGWDMLADLPGYPASRLSGRPPAQRTSKIDYIIVSSGPGGLAGDEVAQGTAVVHDELVTLAGGGFAFREKASDHLPVSVMMKVQGDNGSGRKLDERPTPKLSSSDDPGPSQDLTSLIRTQPEDDHGVRHEARV